MIDFTKYNLDTIGPERHPERVRDYEEYFTRVDPEQRKENSTLIEQCMHDWLSLVDFRKRRKRNRKYLRGDQWHELMRDPESDKEEYITEENLIKRRGKLPLKQNVIRPAVKNLVGQFRVNKTRSIVQSRSREDATTSEMLTNALMAAQDVNHIRELDARNLEEFLISGMAVCKQRYTMWKERNLEDLFAENVNPNRIFFNSSVSDFRGLDIIRIGEIIDAPVEDLIAAFADSKKDEERIRSYYTGLDKQALTNYYHLTPTSTDNLDFLVPQQPNLCRVIEVWELKSKWRVYAHDYLDGSYKIVEKTLDEIKIENQERIRQAAEFGIPADKVPLIDARDQLDQYWYCKYLTPWGDVLMEGETPYEHGEHPYTILLYPLIDGEVWGMVEDIIDQQRYINRIISMLDWIIGNSAKGVLMAPEGSVPANEDPDEWAEKWTRADSVMFYVPKPGVQPPVQVSANSVNIGANELLAVQMQLMKEISGVHGAIQGQSPRANTPASLYAQEAQNATLNSLDIMESFNWFRKRRDIKSLKIITQFYEERNIIISGSDYAGEAGKYKPEEARNIEWDMVVSQSLDAPIFRQAMDEMLFELLKMQGIDIEMFLENTSLPFAQKILQAIKRKREAAEEMAEEGGMNMPADMHPEQVRQQVMGEAQAARQKADPAAMRMIDQAIGYGQRALG